MQGNDQMSYPDQTFAMKAVRYWFENEHFEANGDKSEWVPESKPIWFTELGCSACDHSSNSPNIFVHDGGRLPPYSEKI